MKKLDGELLYQGKPSPYNCPKWKPLIYTDFKIHDKCCSVMKKEPAHQYSKKNCVYLMTAEMACESRLRKQKWLQHGCNGFDMKIPKSTPMAFWTEQDVLEYIYKNNLPIAKPYGKVIRSECQLDLYGGYKCKYETTGCSRTGCIFCVFGAHLEKGITRFQRLRETHPKQYEYCLGGGEFVNGIWQPNKQGLGMRYVFDTLNKLYGDDFIKYEQE